MSSTSWSYSCKNSFRYLASDCHAPQYDNDNDHRDDAIIIHEEQASRQNPISVRMVTFIFVYLFGFLFIRFLPDLVVMFFFIVYGDGC